MTIDQIKTIIDGIGIFGFLIMTGYRLHKFIQRPSVKEEK
jgi:hypothetical protein